MGSQDMDSNRYRKTDGTSFTSAWARSFPSVLHFPRPELYRCEDDADGAKDARYIDSASSGSHIITGPAHVLNEHQGLQQPFLAE